ncbi:MAG: hypothetical protein H7145_22020 [Akkermansiaceae bacterium]|nr:hypothetical protein [Armatimonadota bacterium]
MNRRLCVALVGAASMMPLLWAPTASLAQKKPASPAANLPSPEKVLDGASAAMGSKAAFEKIQTVKMRARLSYPAQKINGTIEMQMRFPDKVYILQQIAGAGKIEQGYDGKVGWSRDPVNGLRILEGGELRQVQSPADEIRSSDWRKVYEKPVMIGVRKVGTADAYAIRMTPKRGGKPVIIFYDVKTKLPVRTDVVLETAQGSVPTQSFSSDFRSVNGVKFPFKSRQVVTGLPEGNITFDAIQINVPVDEKLFAKPKTPARKTAPTAQP